MREGSTAMSDGLTSEAQEEFRTVMRRMVAEHVAPHAAEVDDSASFPQASWDAFTKNALTGLPFPEKFGGAGADLLTQCICIEEIAAACASSALTLLISWVSLAPVVKFGDEALKQRYVTPVADGTSRSAFCLTEPHAGSDVRSIRTCAQRTSDGWSLNGTKQFISNAGKSDFYSVIARSGEAYGVFVVEAQDEGFRVDRLERKMGMRGNPTGSIMFDNVQLGPDRVLGDPSLGYDYMMGVLNESRPLIAAQGLGIAQGAFDEAVKYMQEREQFGRPIAQFQMLRGMVADMKIRIEAARSLLYRTCHMVENGHPRTREFASMAKAFCTDTAMAVAVDALQLHGGNGYMKDFPIERMMRDAKVTQIYEGTNQIQRLLTAQAVFGDSGNKQGVHPSDDRWPLGDNASQRHTK